MTVDSRSFPALGAAPRARVVDALLRQALVRAAEAPDEDTAAAALAPIFFGSAAITALPASEVLRLAALARALRTCLAGREGNAAAWALASALVTDLTLPPDCLAAE